MALYVAHLKRIVLQRCNPRKFRRLVQMTSYHFGDLLGEELPSARFYDRIRRHRAARIDRLTALIWSHQIARRSIARLKDAATHLNDERSLGEEFLLHELYLKGMGEVIDVGSYETKKLAEFFT